MRREVETFQIRQFSPESLSGSMDSNGYSVLATTEGHGSVGVVQVLPCDKT